jgi:hypothetical protein
LELGKEKKMGNYSSSRDDARGGDDHSIPTRPNRNPVSTAETKSSSAGQPTQTEPIRPLIDDGSTKENFVPTVFKWEHGGKHVCITGTFNNWEGHIPMHRSGNDFTYVHNLKKGKHAFKFIVDDEWRYAPDQPTIADVDGQINNFIDVSEFVPYIGDDNFFLKSRERKIGDEEFKQTVPDLDDYTKEYVLWHLYLFSCEIFD